MIDPAVRRRCYAEEIEAVANLTSPAIVDALASVERERFLPRGPWTIRSEGDFQAPPRQTPDADPRHVYHNLAIAIDAPRMLFNGAPSVVAGAIDRLRPLPGNRVLHIGTGLGYYTAIIGRVVTARGHVHGIEVDASLAARTTDNVSDAPWIEIEHGDATAPPHGAFDAILVNAGVTHPLPAWLDALAPGGRMLVPITATMGPTPIGKGPLVLVTRTDDDSRFDARFAGFVAIYSAEGHAVRDANVNASLAEALSRMPFAPVKSLRRDLHDREPSCWLHAPGACLSLN